MEQVDNYNLLVLNPTNNTDGIANSGGVFNFQIGAGCYDVDSMNLLTFTVSQNCIPGAANNVFAALTAGQFEIVYRSDYCHVYNGVTNMVWDGKNRFNAVNHNVAILNHAKKFLQQQDIPVQNFGSTNVNQQWKHSGVFSVAQIEIAAGGAAASTELPKKVNAYYTLRQIFPGSFAPGQKTFFVRSQLQIQINIQNLLGCLAFYNTKTGLYAQASQSQNFQLFPNSTALATGAAQNPNYPCYQFFVQGATEANTPKFQIIVSSLKNQLQLKSQTILYRDPPIIYSLVQVVQINSSGNQIFFVDQNSICYQQGISFTDQTDQTCVDIDIPTNQTTFRVSKNANTIMYQADNGIVDSIVQIQLLLNEHKSYGGLFAIFQQKYNNYSLQLTYQLQNSQQQSVEYYLAEQEA